jgi:hypothetical protein
MPKERKLYNVYISGLTLIQDWLNKKPTQNLSNAFFLPPAWLTTSNTLKRIVLDKGLPTDEWKRNAREKRAEKKQNKKCLNNM